MRSFVTWLHTLGAMLLLDWDHCFAAQVLSSPVMMLADAMVNAACAKEVWCGLVNELYSMCRG